MSDFPETAEGTLVIMVCRAKHLPNRRKLDKQSPYVLLRINTVAKKTPAQFRAGQTPEWTHEIRFQLTRDRRPLMRLDVLDETKGDPTPVGGTDIDCSSVFLDPANLHDSGKYIRDAWYDLSCNGRAAGKIYLEMTFYPSAPVLPPKLSRSVSLNKVLPPPPGHADEDGFRHLAPAVPQLPPLPSSDVFVTGPVEKKPFFRLSAPEPVPAPAHHDDDDVFVDGLRPRASRLAKFKSRFMAKEPISTIWTPEAKKAAEQDRSPEGLPRESLDRLRQELGVPEDTLGPRPPPHSLSSNHRGGYTIASDTPTAVHTSPPRKKAERKPPPGLVDKPRVVGESTAIPFSAENFGLDDSDVLPTKVFHMDQPVKSLTVNADEDRHAMNPNEIDPRFYAPTPSEHLNKSLRLQSGTARYEESEPSARLGYLGEGTWRRDEHTRFSPSVFQRVNDENDGPQNKPTVPPKIPSGLSEREYYILEKDNYLRDMNGRRF